MVLKITISKNVFLPMLFQTGFTELRTLQFVLTKQVETVNSQDISFCPFIHVRTVHFESELSKQLTPKMPNNANSPENQFGDPGPCVILLIIRKYFIICTHLS